MQGSTCKPKNENRCFPLRQNCRQAIRTEFGPRPQHSEFVHKNHLFEFKKYFPPYLITTLSNLVRLILCRKDSVGLCFRTSVWMLVENELEGGRVGEYHRETSRVSVSIIQYGFKEQKERSGLSNQLEEAG